MSRIPLDEHLAEAVVLGGAVLGGGGGGQLSEGLERARLAVRLGSPVLISLDELDDEELIMTASTVGAPAAKKKFVRPVDHIRSTKLILDKRPEKLAGIIANENGARAGVNGWIQSAVLGIPMVDAPADGRAHPTGLMGGMGLHRLRDYTSIQSAVGGNPDEGHYLEMVFEGRLEVGAHIVRYAAVQAGGMVAVSRDPVSAAYVRKHAAPGGTSQAIRVGEAIMAAREKGPEAMIKATTSALEGRVACEGEITDLRLETVGGYDRGTLIAEGERRCEITFWNEFMTLEFEGKREASFPDLISLLLAETGLAISSAEIRRGQKVNVLIVPRDNLLLGKGVCLEETLQEAENAIGKPLINAGKA